MFFKIASNYFYQEVHVFFVENLNIVECQLCLSFVDLSKNGCGRVSRQHMTQFLLEDRFPPMQYRVFVKNTRYVTYQTCVQFFVEFNLSKTSNTSFDGYNKMLRDDFAKKRKKNFSRSNGVKFLNCFI